MESALVRVVFVVQALLLLLLLRIFVIVIIIWAFMQLAHRCRKKQSIIAVRREGGREGPAAIPQWSTWPTHPR